MVTCVRRKFAEVKFETGAKEKHFWEALRRRRIELAGADKPGRIAKAA